MRRGAALLAIVLGLSLAGTRATAQTLVADLSQHLVAINASFDGTEVLLFGAVDAGDDVVVLVHGPLETVVVRRKARTLGVWLNTSSATFAAVPSYYAVAASRPADALMDGAVRARHGIGVDQLDLVAEDVDATEAAAFRAGLVRRKQSEGLYPADEGVIRFVGGGLFRTTIYFPATIRPGRYRVEVLSIRDGRVIAARQSALVITKVGVEAQLSSFARYDAGLYGLGAVGFAIAAGWLAAAAFRRS